MGRIAIVSVWLGLGSVILPGFAALTARANDPKLMSYGRHLAGECSSCHRSDGIDNGIPSITGWPVDDFVATLTFYREGARPNPAMVSVAKSLDEAQMKALATYYNSLPKPSRVSSPK